MFIVSGKNRNKYIQFIRNKYILFYLALVPSLQCRCQLWSPGWPWRSGWRRAPGSACPGTECAQSPHRPADRRAAAPWSGSQAPASQDAEDKHSVHSLCYDVSYMFLQRVLDFNHFYTIVTFSQIILMFKSNSSNSNSCLFPTLLLLFDIFMFNYH